MIRVPVAIRAIMPKKLTISKELSLTDDIVTKTVAILAQRRKGKTYTASVIAEEMVAAKVPFVVLDPTSAWWGLRSSADGKKPGLPVVILGGQHGDLPLERGAGKFIADLVLDHPGWYVIDFGLFESGAAERQFATDFAERLYRRKGQPGMDFPLHLFVDEADRFVPQRVSGGRGEGRESDQRLLGAFESIVRRGGLRGLGTTLISQRAAVVNKNVLEQIDILIMLRIMGPNDRRAIEDYLKADADDEQRKALMSSLASLDIGEAWLWEPGGEPPLFDRVHIRERHTFNSSATPKPGQSRVEPSKFAKVDLDAVKSEMQAAIERAKSDDPKELRKKIADLEHQLKTFKPVETIATVEIEVEKIVEVVPEWVTTLRVDLQKILDEVVKEHADLFSSPLRPGLRKVESPPRRGQYRVATTPEPKMDKTGAPPPPPRNRPDPNDEVNLGRCERAILSVLAQFPHGRTRQQVATLSGYSVTSGGFANSLGKLRTLGFIEGRGDLQITDSGSVAIDGQYDPLPTGPALLTHWQRKLGKCERAILHCLVDAWPKSMARDDIATTTGYSPTSGGFANSLGKLRTLELIEGRGELKADDTLAREVQGR